MSGTRWNPTEHPLADPLADAAVALASDCIGALIAIQRGINLATYVETGERDRQPLLRHAAAHLVHAEDPVA